MSRLTQHNVSLVSIFFGFLICLSASVYGASDERLQDSTQTLKNSAFELQSDINQLERDILFPPLLRTDLYLSVQVAGVKAKDFTVKQVLVKVDAVEVIDYWYSVEQSSALVNGSKQLLWQGNLSLGKHRVNVAYQFVNKRGKAISGEQEFMFTKTRDQQPLLLNFVYEGGVPSASLSPKHP